ncbi:MAG: hypothetical protein ACE5J5_02950 [Candidatus Hydrothermarchaeales archaeon]
MGIEKAFKDSFHLFKDNLKFILPHFFEYVLDFALFIAFVIFAVLLIGVSLLRASFSSFQNPEALASHLGASGFFIVSLLILATLVLILATVIFSASSRTAIIGMAKEGLKLKKTSLSTGWINVKEHGLMVFGFIILLGIILIPLVFLGFFPAIIVSFFNGSGFLRMASLFFSVLLSFLFVAIVYILIMFTPQCIVLESLGIIDGVKRSYAFVKNNVLLVLEYLVIAVVISIFVIVATSIGFLPLKFITRGSTLGGLVVKIFENLISLLAGLILTPYFEIVKTHMVFEWKSNEIVD